MASSVKPKTIIITSTQKKHSLLSLPQTVTISVPMTDTMMEDQQPRKRRRLTNLSPEEKMLRRKLKNRVAAQTARDRKKAQMSDLEIKLAVMEAENKKLQRENMALRTQSGVLAQENTELKKRLSGAVSGRPESESHRSAASAVPLLKEQIQALSGWDAIHSLCPDSQSDVLFGLLQQLDSETDELESKEEAIATSETDSSNKKQPQPQPQVVGPTTTELESLNELIKFDHIYYKAPCVTKETSLEACETQTGENLKDIEACNASSSPQQKKSSLPGQCDEPEIPVLELEELPDNFQLLEDLQDLFKEDLLSNTSVPDVPGTDFIPQEIQSQNTCDSSKGKKRKLSVSSDSAYSSDIELVDLTMEASSPFQSQDLSDVSSPMSDLSSPLGDNPWEEDFTDLFPALI
ncbi:LOW QUALITY PROTEIN: uncharacterized protein LOC121367524 [Gigantopelta aegis]|uniref:LOW QUALITY PROTEIN: uncharacterized protein LOC121367524 n=1 Tax=Gigantopelta aegis TaxID=1735272 RepID=UPI001B88DA26|nr:LOW QUALITY PROTEIN: uncharacterized protein LOC121367524 [Gigantopelta aegis]